MSRGRLSFSESAFTLLDALVLMAIIVIFASLLVPTMAGGREKARRAACMSNLQRIGTALSAYAGDYSEYLPGDPGWGAANACHFANDSSFADCQTLCNVYAQGMVGQGPAIDCGPKSQLDYWIGTYVAPPGSKPPNAQMAGSQHLVHVGWNTGDGGGVGVGAENDNPASWYGVIAYNRDNVLDVNTMVVDTPSNWSAGNVTLAPTGLGMLGASNYIQDLQLFYCPTGRAYDVNVESVYAGFQHSDMEYVASKFGYPSWEGFGGNWAGSNYVNTSLANLKLLGGAQSYYLTHGDLTAVALGVNNGNGVWYGNWTGSGLCPVNYMVRWTGNNQWVEGAAPGGSATWNGCGGSVAIGCSYAYRNQSYTDAGMHINHRLWSCGCAPDVMPRDFPSLYIPGEGAADPTGALGWYNRMPSPRFVQFQNACPERKTTKMLGSLSIAADRFDTHIDKEIPLRTLNQGTWWGGNMTNTVFLIPGMGWYGHKIGYNVLFGDGHVAWSADPQQWWIWAWNSLTTEAQADAAGPFCNAVTPWGRPIGNDTVGSNPYFANGTVRCGGGLGFGAGIFTLFDDAANHEATGGFYLGEWVSDYNVGPTN